MVISLQYLRVFRFLLNALANSEIMVQPPLVEIIWNDPYSITCTVLCEGYNLGTSARTILNIIHIALPCSNVVLLFV